MRRLLLGLAILLLAGACESGPHLLPPVVATASSYRAAAGGTITGGVAPCAGIPVPDAPRYAQATVTLLRGTVTWRAAGPGFSEVVFPPTVVAAVALAADQPYLFRVGAGSYVLRAQYPGGDVRPWTAVKVAAGQVVERDVPNMCK